MASATFFVDGVHEFHVSHDETSLNDPKMMVSMSGHSLTRLTRVIRKVNDRWIVDGQRGHFYNTVSDACSAACSDMIDHSRQDKELRCAKLEESTEIRAFISDIGRRNAASKSTSVSTKHV